YSKQLYIDDNVNLVLNCTISIYTSSGDSTNLEDLASCGGFGPQYLHIKYSDDCLTFTGNVLSTSIDKWVSGVAPSRDTIDTDVVVGAGNNVAMFYTTEEPSLDNGHIFDYASIDTNGDTIEVGDWVVTPSKKVYVVSFVEDYGVEASYDETLEPERYAHYITYIDALPVVPGTQYVATSNNDSIRVYIKQYDVDGNYVSSSELSSNLTIEVPDGIYYFRVMLQGTDGTDTYDSFVSYFENEEVIPDMRDASVETGTEIGLYIGTYIDTNTEDSEVFDDYEWTVFTEDVAKDIDALREQLQTTTDNLNASIENATNNLHNAIQSESEKINASIDDKIAGVNSSVTEQINSASSTIDQKYAGIIADVNDQLAAHKAEVGQYMTFNDNGLTLGAVSSDFKTVIDNAGLYFKQGDIIVSYVNNNQLYIPNAVIENTLILGNFFFSPREDGGVSLTWQE
ncbi:MAG: apolipoprotein A1/A4/E family protein, partial [Paludibacteraceae bacterium]|nr:apolipoprotein A1/A4/E family protein [Paludibacteraceae bacterium]